MKPSACPSGRSWWRGLPMLLLMALAAGSDAADVAEKRPKSPFIGLESRVAALVREFPRALAFRPPEEDREGETYRFVKAAKPLFERFNLPVEGLYEALRSHVLSRLSKKDLKGIELARFYFMIHRYAETVEVALIAGEEAHHAKSRVPAEVTAALELAGYAALEQRKYGDARQYFTVAATETDAEADLGAWTQIQTAQAYTSYLLADYPGQQKILRAVMDQHRLALGPGHLETLRYHNELAATLYDQRQDAAAETEYRIILQRLEEKGDPDSAALVSVRKNLASVLESLKRFADAELLLRAVLETQLRTLNKVHDDVIKTRFRVVECMRDARKYKEVEEELRSLLEFMQLYFGADDIRTLACRRKLASFTFDMGRYVEAATQFQVLYEQEKKVLGTDDPESWTAYNDLGVCFNEMRQSDRAEGILKKVLDWRLKNLPPDHPDTLGTRNNLGIAYERQKKLEQAKEQYLIAYRGRERTLGPNHPRTLGVLNNLTGMESKEDDNPEATLQQYRDILQQLLQSRGPEHPQTLLGRFNIALKLESLGRYAEAEKELQIVHETRLRVLGAGHPETMEIFCSVTSNLLRQQRNVEAEKMMRSGMATLRENMEPDDLKLIQFYYFFTYALAINNKLDEASLLLAQTLETLIKSKGENFPLVADLRKNLTLFRELRQNQEIKKYEGEKIIGGISAAAVMQKPAVPGGGLPISIPLALPAAPPVAVGSEATPAKP